MKGNEGEKKKVKGSQFILIESEVKFSVSQEFSMHKMQGEGSVVLQFSRLFGSRLGI